MGMDEIKSLKNLKFEDVFDGKDRTIVRILETMEKYKMLSGSDKVLISISGGPDSTFLALVLAGISREYRLTLYGFCLDHVTRNGESTIDAVFAEQLCNLLGIKYFTEKINAKAWSRERKLSFQEGARLLRIRRLEAVSDKWGVDKIAVGHNADDNVETFIMRLIRGSGSRGLSGIKPVSGKFIRPLIDITRRDILGYLRKKKIPYRTDKSNLENFYMRNRIRNIFIPFVNKNFSRSFSSNILRTIDILSTEDNFINQYAGNTLNKISRPVKIADGSKTGLLELDIAGLQQCHKALKRRVIASAVMSVAGSLNNITYKNIEDIYKLCNAGGASKRLKPAGNILVYKAGDLLYIINTNMIEDLPPGYRSLVKHSETSGKAYKRGKHSESQILHMKDLGRNIKLRSFPLYIKFQTLTVDSIKDSYLKAGKNEAFLDLDSLRLPLFVSAWCTGERFYPLGMSKPKKIQDFFTDEKISENARHMIPIIHDQEKVVWVGNHRIDDRAKVTGDTQKILFLRLFEK